MSNSAPCLDEREFARIARAIEFIREHHRAQPSIDSIACSVHLSAAHFSRLFHRWSGVTPKQFLQQLTLDTAQRALADDATVFDAAIAAGLSGPGRLHDLFVSLAAATPGEFKRRGAGLTMQHGAVATPFGAARLARCERGIAFFGFADAKGQVAGWEEFALQWRAADWQQDDALAATCNAMLWNPAARPGEPLRLWVQGTGFQVKVWRALLKHGVEGTLSYGDLAAAIDAPQAARAVGGAVGANALAWLIPCHRVLRADGATGGYRWGVERKRAMLTWEYLRSASP